MVDRCKPGQWRPVLRHAENVAKRLDPTADPVDIMERTLVLCGYCVRSVGASGFDAALRQARRGHAEDLVEILRGGH